MSLVEVVCGLESSEQSIATAVGFVRQLKKIPVAMNDGPGFVVNRLLAAMLDQSLRILMTGSSIEEIDHAMREFGFLGGPFEIIDVIGADTCMYAGRTMWEAGLQCVSLSPILPRLVKLGRLGRKTGAGFYRYPDRRGERQSDPEAIAMVERYGKRPTKDDPNSTPTIPPEKIVTQILSAMVLEATRIIDEKIVADFRDLELCVIHGFSFPQHQGGILYWADRVGLETVNQTLFEIAAIEPKLEPSDLLKSMRHENRTFYSTG
jgi:3-hydroxyacyl-CoA dehydrogenase